MHRESGRGPVHFVRLGDESQNGCSVLVNKSLNRRLPLTVRFAMLEPPNIAINRSSLFEHGDGRGVNVSSGQRLGLTGRGEGISQCGQWIIEDQIFRAECCCVSGNSVTPDPLVYFAKLGKACFLGCRRAGDRLATRISGLVPGSTKYVQKVMQV